MPVRFSFALSLARFRFASFIRLLRPAWPRGMPPALAPPREQYTLFLLYASFAHSPRLQELLLGRCESSVHTAHTIFWFLRAFCLRGARVTPVGVKAIEQVRAAASGRDGPGRGGLGVGGRHAQ